MPSRPPSITKLSSSTVQDCQLVRVASVSLYVCLKEKMSVLKKQNTTSNDFTYSSVATDLTREEENGGNRLGGRRAGLGSWSGINQQAVLIRPGAAGCFLFFSFFISPAGRPGPIKLLHSVAFPQKKKKKKRNEHKTQRKNKVLALGFQESKLTVGHVRASLRPSEKAAELPWEFTWSRRPTRHESLKRKTQILKQKSRRRIKDVGSVKRKGHSFLFPWGRTTWCTASRSGSAVSSEGDNDKWLMSITLTSSLSPQTAPAASKSDASVSCHLP